MYYSLKKDYDSAIVYFNKALIVKEKTDSNNYRRLGTSYNNLAYTYVLLADSKNALKFSKKALSTLERILGKEHPIIAKVLGVMANAYFTGGNQEEGLKCLRSGLEISRKKLGEVNETTALFYHEVGKYSGDTSEQIAYFLKAIEIKIKCSGHKHPMLSAYYHNLSTAYVNDEQYEEALSFLQKAINSLFKNFNTTDVYILPPITAYTSGSDLLAALELKAYTFYMLFLRFEQEVNFEASIQHYQLAVKLIDHIRRGYHTSGSQLSLSITTVKTYQRGIRVLTENQGDCKCSKMAFLFSEKSKAILLLSSLQDSLAKTITGISKELLEKEKQLKIKLTSLEKSIQKIELQESKKDEELLKNYQSEFFNFHQQYLQLLQQLETDYPDYYQLKYDTKTVTPTELQSTLEEHQVILSYFVGKDKLYIFIVTPDEFEVIDLQLPTDFEALVQGFMDALTQHQYATFVEKSHQLHQLLIAPIRNFIVDDFGFDEEEEELTQVFVIPHGVLSYVPFEALISSPPQPLARREATAKVSAITENSPTFEGFGNVWSGLDYLLHHCQISYHYSATLLYRHLLKKQTEAELPNSFAGFAPIYDASIPSKSNTEIKAEGEQADALQQSAKSMQQWATRSEAIRSDGTWVSLPHSETEAKGIAELFEEKGLEAETFLREKANKEGFAEAAKRFKFLLVAAHGLVNDEKTALSDWFFIRLNKWKIRRRLKNTATIWNDERSEMSPSLSDVGESTSTDNILSMEETHHLDLQADLVVLSSCESGIGKLHKGEGMMAVNRGFLAAGANNVVSTLFKVYDKPSSLLTQYLFEGILKGESYAAALRLAKLKLMQRPNIDPKSWSGFVLIGG